MLAINRGKYSGQDTRILSFLTEFAVLFLICFFLDFRSIFGETTHALYRQ